MSPSADLLLHLRALPGIGQPGHAVPINIGGSGTGPFCLGSSSSSVRSSITSIDSSSAISAGALFFGGAIITQVPDLLVVDLHAGEAVQI
jgi:hypothetical protein